MERGNVLIIGNSGVGKSTLINAVLGEEKAKTSWGDEGGTKHLEIYESERIPFRIIDTIGFEPNLIKEMKAVNAVKKWSKNSAKEGHEDSRVNLIWFCIDGTSRKLFPKVIKNLSRATSFWENVPIIVVITKSYSVPDRVQNIEMVHNAFAKQKKYSKNLKSVIPVVASTFVLNDTAFAAPEGILELIDKTNELMPDGIKAAEVDVQSFKLMRTRAIAQSVVAASTTAAVAVGAVPIPFPDAVILTPLEVTLVNGLSRIYNIQKGEESKLMLQSIIDVGTVGVLAKQAIIAIKAIPGINIAGSVLNAAIAGSIVAAIGEGSIYVFEQIYLGKKSVSDIEWVKEFMETYINSEFLNKVNDLVKGLSQSSTVDSIAKLVGEVFFSKPSKK